MQFVQLTLGSGLGKWQRSRALSPVSTASGMGTGYRTQVEIDSQASNWNDFCDEKRMGHSKYTLLRQQQALPADQADKHINVLQLNGLICQALLSTNV